jgi:competence protein ComEC
LTENNIVYSRVFRSLIMSRPAIPLVVAFIVGLFLGDALLSPGIPYVLPVLILIFISLGVLYFLKPAWILGGGMFFLLAVGIIQTSNFSPRNTTPPVPAFLLDQQARPYSGIIEQEPTFSPDRTRLIVRLKAYRFQDRDSPIQGVILLTVKGILETLEAGDPIRFVCRLHPIEGYHNPGGYDFQRVMARQGIRVTGFLEHPDLLVLSGPNNTLGKRFSILATRYRVNALIDAHIAPPLNGIARALLTGDQSKIPPEIREAFNQAGVAHLLAFSGLNLGLVGGLAFFFLRFLLSLSERALLYLNVRFWAMVGSFVPVLGYALLAGLSPPVSRALLMVTLVFLALLLKKQSDLLNNLALAALILLLLSPASLFRASFQLSFLSVWAIGYLLPQIWPPASDPRQPDRSWSYRGLLYLWGIFCISLVSQLATIPAVTWWFHQISFVGLISNLVLVPLTGVLVVPAGLLAILLSPVFPWATAFLFKITALLLEGTWDSTRLFASLPGAFIHFPRPAWPEILFYYLALMLLFNRRKIPRASWALGLTLAGLVIAFSFPQIKTVLGLRPLALTFLDVGHGSAVLVEFPSGENLLVDGGGSPNPAFDLGERVVGPFLRQHKILSLDTVVLTHPHPDHLNGLPFILEKFKVREFWWNGERIDSETFYRLENLIRSKKIPVLEPRSGWTRTYGAVRIEVLHPEPGSLQGSAGSPWQGQNNHSLVLQIDYQDQRVLLPADSEAGAENRLLARGPALRSQILQVPHHGSLTSSQPAFIEAVAPSWAVFSARGSARFPVPHPEVLRRYQEKNIPILRTDQEGAIRFWIEDGEWRGESYLKGPIPVPATVN